MRKNLLLLTSVCAMLAFTGCSGSSSTASTTATSTTAATTTAAETTTVADTTAEAAGDVMTYEQFLAADVDSAVTVITYVAAAQDWWENNGVGTASIYAQDEEGAYFLYNAKISKEDYDKMKDATGTPKIKVSGYKAEWSGEVEISDATIEILSFDQVSFTPEDVTALLGTDELKTKMNFAVSFTNLEIAPSKDADGNEVAFLYKWDGSGVQGDDLYFNVTDGKNTYSFTVESYLCGKDSEVYQAVEALNVGDKVDLGGFLYWYEGPQPHIVACTVK